MTCPECHGELNPNDWHEPEDCIRTLREWIAALAERVRALELATDEDFY